MRKVIFALALLVSVPAQAIETKEEHSLNVNGIGEVEVAVDNVTISAGVNTRDKSLANAKDENSKKYDSLLEVLKKNGLDKSAIKANSTSINPVYVNCYANQPVPQTKCDASKIDYYDVNHSLQIKLNDLSKYDAIIAGMAEGGASSVNTGEYNVSNISKYRDQARDMAIDAARGKAEKVAKKLGVMLGKPIRFDSYDNSAESPMPPPPSGAVYKMRLAATPIMATDTQTMGKIKVSVNVNIAYGIE